ncbi:MAG: hypothetical protein ACREIF_00890 [Chthoniobacterales bacterium]
MSFKFFRRSRDGACQSPGAANAGGPATPRRNPVLEYEAIALSDVHKQILQQPVDPRVARILQKINAEREVTEAFEPSPRIINFPTRGIVASDDRAKDVI